MKEPSIEGHVLPKDPEVVLKTVDASDTEALLRMVELDKKIFGEDAHNVEELRERLSKGGVFYVFWSGDRAVGMAAALTEADPLNDNPLRRNLPPESIFAGLAAVDPEFRGQSLQKDLLEKRIDLVHQLKKETIVGTVRPENGSSLRNIIRVGGRVFAYSADFFPKSKIPARLTWEIDATLPKETEEKLEKEDGLTPDEALEAMKKLEKKIVLFVKTGEDVDVDAQKAMAKILSGDYIGTGLQSLYTDSEGHVFNGMTFRHLSVFPPEVEKRLRERKKKIQKILKSPKNIVAE